MQGLAAIISRRISTSAAKTMRLVQFTNSDVQYVGVELEKNGKVAALPRDVFPSDMVSFLKGGDTLMAAAKKLLGSLETYDRKDITLLSPITNPDKVVCVGMNYIDHCKEQNAPIPKEPIIFNKFPSSISGPFDDIILPKLSHEVDWEVELVIVIGKEGKNISQQQAMDHVFGFTVANDVSARDWQMRKNGKQWLLGKTFDTFCPMGPCVVTKDEISNPHNLPLKCVVNGQVMQDSNTNQLVFKTEEIIEWISAICTLKPGDVILTGTPPGVGVFRKPPIFLKEEDVVSCEISEIGTITSKVRSEN